MVFVRAAVSPNDSETLRGYRRDRREDGVADAPDLHRDDPLSWSSVPPTDRIRPFCANPPAGWWLTSEKEPHVSGREVQQVPETELGGLWRSRRAGPRAHPEIGAVHVP